MADSPPELTIAGGDDVAFVGGDALDEAVVGVGAGVGAGEAFEARVAGDAEGDTIPGPEFFEFGHYTVCYTRYTFGVETVHHS